MVKPLSWGVKLPRFLRISPSFGLVALAVIVLLAVAGPMVSGDPNRISPAQRLQFFSAEHLLGTDGLGRDLFARIANGASVSMLVGLYVGLAATVIGVAIGLVAGYFKRVDSVIMRVMDGMMAIPPLLLAVALASIGEASFGMVVFALTIPEIPRIVRVARSEVLTLRTRLYIDAAVVSGSSAFKIMYRHIVPNLVAPLSIQITYVCAHAILAEAGLSFIGAGLPPDNPSWGVIVSENRSYFQSAPWTIFVPGFFLTITILAVSSLGDRLREKFGG